MSEIDENRIEINRSIHLGRLIGKGGMGRVVDGFAGDYGQYFAVKILNPEHSKDEEMRSRFDEEIAIMSSIDHPGNLPIYGSSKDSQGNPCYVMKKVKGKTLAEELAIRGNDITNAPLRQHLLHILLDACETVGSAHATGIVHRDIKPENILIDDEDSVFVIDWGIAKRMGANANRSEATRTIVGQVMGSAGYMSPEQADGRAATAGPQSDVFALGAVLYEILTGHRPFKETDSRKEILSTIHNDPKSPRGHSWLIPRTISAVCMKSLSKDPSHRYPDARLLAKDLRNYLEGLPVSALKPNITEKFRYYASRRPIQAFTFASLLLTSLFVTTFIGVQVWIDETVADKARTRLAMVDEEISRIESAGRGLRNELENPKLTETEKTKLNRKISLLNSRWILSEFEAMRVLSGVTHLRFIRVDSEIAPEAKMRLMNLIGATKERKLPALGIAIIDTISEREKAHTLNLKLSDSELSTLRELKQELEQQVEDLANPPARSSAPPSAPRE